MNTIRVLVSGAGGDVGQGVIKSLARCSLDVEVYATCISVHSSWLHKVANSFIAPLSASDEYVPFLIRLMKRYGIDVFIPTVDGEIAKISREKERIERESGAIVFVDSPQRVAISDDKLETAEFLRINGFAYPISAAADTPDARDLVRRFGYPVMAKRRCGRGSQDVVCVENEGQLRRYLGDASYMLQEWMNPAQGEYTSGIYLGDDGEVKGMCTFRRKLKGGSTYIAERIVDPVLEEPLEDIARTLGMKYLNVQSMRRGNTLVPFEFNGRLSGTTAMVSRIFNAPEMFIRERVLQENLRRGKNSETFIAMRFYEEIYTTPEKINKLIARSRL